MARPSLPPEQKQSRYVVFRVSQAQFARLQQLSEDLGKPLGTLIRQTLFSGKFPRARTPRVDLQTYGELKRIGVNLNQLARKVNAGVMAPELPPLLRELVRQQRRLIAALLEDDRHSEDR